MLLGVGKGQGFCFVLCSYEGEDVEHSRRHLERSRVSLTLRRVERGGTWTSDQDAKGDQKGMDIAKMTGLYRDELLGKGQYRQSLGRGRELLGGPAYVLDMLICTSAVQLGFETQLPSLCVVVGEIRALSGTLESWDSDRGWKERSTDCSPTVSAQVLQVRLELTGWIT